nr:RDEA [Dictyostelium discoideum]
MISDYEGPTPTKKFDQDILFDYSEGEKEFTFELLDSYISSVEEHLPELLNSFEAKDLKGAVLHSHDIKGSSSYIGCEAVRYVSGKIEAYCKNDELEKAESFYPELKKEVEEVFKILSDFKKNWDKNHGEGGSDDGGDDNESEPTENNNNDGSSVNNNDSSSCGGGKDIENKNTDKNTGKNLNGRSKSPVPLQTTLKPVTIETPKTASDKIATETPTSLANNTNSSSNNNSKNENGLNSKQPQTSSNSPTKIQTK